MPFAKIYSDVLSPFINNYKVAKTVKDKNLVVTNAVDTVKQSKEMHEYDEELPKDLPKVGLIHVICILIHRCSLL